MVTLHEAHGTVRNRLIVVPAGLSSVSVLLSPSQLAGWQLGDSLVGSSHCW